jgi:hypothetical protein
MAISIAISTKELERQAKLVFEGQTYKLFLATKGALTVDSTRAAWEAVEVSGSGYVAATGTVPAGSYSTGNGRYEMPSIRGTFTAAGGGFTYDTVCLAIGGSAFLHSVLTESPLITLAAGQSKSYTLTLIQDD